MRQITYIQCFPFEGRAFLSERRILCYPILPQHIRYYVSKRKLSGENEMIVSSPKLEKWDILLV